MTAFCVLRQTDTLLMNKIQTKCIFKVKLNVVKDSLLTDSNMAQASAKDLGQGNIFTYI